MEKIKTHFLLNTFCFRKSCHLWGNAEVLIFMKICPLAAEVFWVEKQTDMTKLVIAFRNFGNALNKSQNCRQRFDKYALEYRRNFKLF